MPDMNDNTAHKTDVPVKKTPMIPIVVVLLIALVVGVMSYMYFFPAGVPTE